MQLIDIQPNSGLYSIWQACTLDWIGFQSLLVVTFVGTWLPQIMSSVPCLVQICQVNKYNRATNSELHLCFTDKNKKGLPCAEITLLRFCSCTNGQIELDI